MQNPSSSHRAETALAQWFNDAYDLPADAELDTEGLETIVAGVSKDELANLAYFAGRFLQLRGNTDLAKSYYERVLQTHRMNKWNYTLSAVRLREM